MKRKMVRGLTLSCCIVPCTTSGAFGQFAYVSSFNGPARAIVDLDPTEKLDFVSRFDSETEALPVEAFVALSAPDTITLACNLTRSPLSSGRSLCEFWSIIRNAS